MANKILSLSEEDAEVLRKIIRDIKQHPRPQSRYREEREIGQSPEVYVARTPAGGIAAITEAPGTGTGDFDHAGYAECNVYKVVSDGVLRELRQVDGLTRIVHNLSNDAVPGNSYVVIEKDKFGTWWVELVADNLVVGDTTPPECPETTFKETDLRCETMTGTGTSQQGSLNLYRRDVIINVDGGCLTKSYGPWEFIRAVACCDPECEQEESQERFYWCINDGAEPGTIATDCCVELIPATLTGTITNKTGTCTCLPSSISLVTDMAGGWVWNNPEASCTGSLDLVLDCPGGGPTWRMVSGGLMINPTNANVGATCDPLNIVFDCTVVGGQCAGAFRITITA